MLAVLVTIAAMQLGDHDALSSDIARFGRIFIVSSGCARMGYEVDFDPLHDMQRQIESRASEAGMPEAEISRRINESIVRHETDLPPRNLPEDASPSQIMQHLRDVKEVYPLRCGQLAWEAPEALTSEGLKSGDAQLIERMSFFETLYARAPESK